MVRARSRPRGRTIGQFAQFSHPGIHYATLTSPEDNKLPRRARAEIEDTGTEIIFHHLHDASVAGRKKVRAAPGPTFAQSNAPGGLRQVDGYEAWELGALAAAEDERLFGSND